MDLSQIQSAIRQNKLDGWLLYSFRENNPIAVKILQLGHMMQKRRFFYFIPANGTPQKLVHGIERYNLDSVPGDKTIYSSWQDLDAGLKKIVGGAKRIAMEYSAECQIPYLSIVDAGTIELVRRVTGTEIASSADLVQYFDATWDDEQWQLHQDASKSLMTIIEEAWNEIRSKILAKKKITEYDVQVFINERFKAHGMHGRDMPNCSVNKNAGNPHYEPTPENCLEIKEGDLVLIDWWSKKNHPRAVYADYTQMGFVGKTVPDKFEKIFKVVCGARDTAIEFINKKTKSGEPLYGWEVDDICREHIRKNGYAEYFIHRTGHSIGEEVHGNGANIDNLETKDNRRIIPQTCFSIEPGIYFVDEFGVRTEINVYIGKDKDVVVTGTPLQQSIRAILA